ncbi:hypothetical protein SASPL_120432 [Salvia splendens]|uniref:Chromo domain-containing protein n=1 Tax=Salvia splendens TaxID=180675 RepID=A0A8X8XVG4_SALSN|nr:hypothetical protein SASPL_120432 [Salvia splendens]
MILIRQGRGGSTAEEIGGWFGQQRRVRKQARRIRKQARQTRPAEENKEEIKGNGKRLVVNVAGVVNRPERLSHGSRAPRHQNGPGGGPASRPALRAVARHPAVVDTLRSRDEVLELLRHHLRRAQDRMTASANKKRRDVEFAAGDMVYVRFRPHRQSTLFSSRNRKMAPRFFGPFRIESHIGATAYRLQLPESTRIHLVFHVSLLKRAVGDAAAEANLPEGLGGNDPPFLPEKVLDTRTDHREGEDHSQVLIKWQGMNDDDSTWMDARRIRKQAQQTRPAEENKEEIKGNGKRLVVKFVPILV